MTWPLSDNLTVSLISAIGTIAATLFAWKVKLAFKRDDVAASGLSAQIGGWNNLATQLRELNDDLDEKLRRARDDCDKQLDDLRREMRERDERSRQRDEQCKRRIEELERRFDHGN